MTIECFKEKYHINLNDSGFEQMIQDVKNIQIPMWELYIISKGIEETTTQNIVNACRCKNSAVLSCIDNVNQENPLFLGSFMKNELFHIAEQLLNNAVQIKITT